MNADDVEYIKDRVEAALRSVGLNMTVDAPDGVVLHKHDDRDSYYIEVRERWPVSR